MGAALEALGPPVQGWQIRCKIGRSRTESGELEDTVSYYFDHRNVTARRVRRLRTWTVEGDITRPSGDAIESWLDADRGELPEEFFVVQRGFEVCPTCEGHGTHVNPSIDAGGISREFFEDDPDFAEAYTSGGYDVTCSGCDGLRVVHKRPICNHPLWAAWTAWLDEVCEDDPSDVSEARYFGY